MPCLLSISTPNSQHPTPNIQVGEFQEHPVTCSSAAYCTAFLGRWLLDVGCWTFDSLDAYPFKVAKNPVPPKKMPLVQAESLGGTRSCASEPGHRLSARCLQVSAVAALGEGGPSDGRKAVPPRRGLLCKRNPSEGRPPAVRLGSATPHNRGTSPRRVDKAPARRDHAAHVRLDAKTLDDRADRRPHWAAAHPPGPADGGDILAMLGFNMVDTLFVGRLGTLPLAAMAMTFPIVMVMTSLSLGLSVSTSIAVSQAVGRGATLQPRSRRGAGRMALLCPGRDEFWSARRLPCRFRWSERAQPCRVGHRADCSTRCVRESAARLATLPSVGVNRHLRRPGGGQRLWRAHHGFLATAHDTLKIGDGIARDAKLSAQCFRNFAVTSAGDYLSIAGGGNGEGIGGGNIRR